MADLISLDEFKEVLDVGDIYSDATLQSVIDSATDLLWPMLTLNRAGLIAYQLVSGTARVWTNDYHEYVVGQHVIIEGIAEHFNGNQTITAVGLNYFEFAVAQADVTKRRLTPWGFAYLQGQDSIYDTNENVRMAALIIAVDMWAARQTASGMGAAVDFTPSPYKMGRSLLSRVSGLIQRERDVRGYIA